MECVCRLEADEVTWGSHFIKCIYQAVISVIDVYENMELNGGDDVDDDTPPVRGTLKSQIPIS